MAPRDRVFLDDNTNDDKPPLYFIEESSQSENDEDMTKRIRPTKVSFHLVHVREFERVVGDHPEAKVGPPIALGWNYVQRSPVVMETYHADRNDKRRLHRLTSIARKNLLLEYGYTEDDFRTAERSVKMVREQRSNAKTDDRSKLQKVGSSLRKNLLRSLSATAKVMAPPMVLVSMG